MKGSVPPGRAVKIGLMVSDVARSVDFYRAAFGFRWLPDIWAFQIGDYPEDGFFLISLNDVAPEDDRPIGGGHFGCTVEDVDAAHRGALDAGATDWYAPHDNSGAPRSAGVHDPDGNRIELFQA